MQFCPRAQPIPLAEYLPLLPSSSMRGSCRSFSYSQTWTALVPTLLSFYYSLLALNDAQRQAAREIAAGNSCRCCLLHGYCRTLCLTFSSSSAVSAAYYHRMLLSCGTSFAASTVGSICFTVPLPAEPLMLLPATFYLSLFRHQPECPNLRPHLALLEHYLPSLAT